MSSTYGENLKLSIFGQSHSPAIGMVLDGIPAGLPVDTQRLQEFLNRRAPGQNDYSTPRREEDSPEFLGGILDGFTCGAPIAAVIRNRNTRSGDYANLRDCPRPGHADYTAQIKYGGFQDYAGGGLRAAYRPAVHRWRPMQAMAGRTGYPNRRPDCSHRGRNR